ncbi:hypothetical protein D3C75_1062230 [compost metagenome]
MGDISFDHRNPVNQIIVLSFYPAVHINKVVARRHPVQVFNRFHGVLAALRNHDVHTVRGIAGFNVLVADFGVAIHIYRSNLASRYIFVEIIHGAVFVELGIHIFRPVAGIAVLDILGQLRFILIQTKVLTDQSFVI